MKTPDTESPVEAPTFRKSTTWLKIIGVAHSGKKAKRLIHRRDRHQARKHLSLITDH